MGRQRTKAEEGERIVNTTTGETGTIVFIHTETTPKPSPPNYSVLPDSGRKRRVLWKGPEAEFTVGRPGSCGRCGEKDHSAVQCPYGHLGDHLTAEGRAALEALGLDPRRVPGTVDGEDAYDGIPLTVLGNDPRSVERINRTIHQQMRRRVCEVDGVVVDGHAMIDGACKHCGGTE